MTPIRFFQPTVPVVFSLLLHGLLVMAGFLFPDTENPPAEKIYRVSIAAFAPTQTSLAPEQGVPSPSPASVKPEMPPRPSLRQRIPQRTRDTWKRTGQVSVRKPQSARMPQNPLETGEGATRGTARTVGTLSVYAEDAVDQRPSIALGATPEYPDKARWRRLQGRVVVQVVVDVSGKPRHCSVYASEPAGVFDEAALAAARRTRFLPGRIKGRPVATLVLIPYIFSLR